MEMGSRITELGALAGPLVEPAEGCATTRLMVPGLGLWHSATAKSSEPAMFEPRLYVVLRGSKTMTFATRHARMTPGMFALSSVGVPFTTAVESAPYLGVGLELSAAKIGEMLCTLPSLSARQAPTIAIGQLEQDLLEPISRLLSMCHRQGEPPILGPLVVEEIHYRLLTGRFGDTVRQLNSGGRRMTQIRKAVALLKRTDDPLPDVATIARAVGMSVTSFHRHFKMITGHGPLEYAKHLRLLKARDILMGEGSSIAETAHVVGYMSASQFSREYKRKFGISPRHDVQNARRSSGSV